MKTIATLILLILCLAAVKPEQPKIPVTYEIKRYVGFDSFSEDVKFKLRTGFEVHKMTETNPSGLVSYYTVIYRK